GFKVVFYVWASLIDKMSIAQSARYCLAIRHALRGFFQFFFFPEICALFHKLLLISKEALIFLLTTENLRILMAKIIKQFMYCLCMKKRLKHE
ncbi:MAG: hypothetical protein AABX27_01605, partial [Nanoarchaeota archaeon]